MAEYEGTRLHAYLARCGVASRRKCEELIDEGRVRVDGEVVRRKGFKVREGQKVEFDGRQVRPAQERIYLALNKPVRYLCSNFDPEGRPLASSLLSEVKGKRLFHVGRLDFMSSGLIFYTDDGDFANRIMHPSSQVEKEYVVKTREPVKKDVLEAFIMGVPAEGETLSISSYVLLDPRTMRVVLTEGKNREIRRLFQHARIEVRKIHRVRIGEVRIKGLKSGEFRHLTKREIESFN